MPQVPMSRSIRIKGPSRVAGITAVPGDKSISHRVAMISSIADGPSTITGFASSADCWSTIDCIERLGITVDKSSDKLVIHGRGLKGYRTREPLARLDAGNSGSTMRMLTGILAGQPLDSEIDGDASLRRRPMARIIEPLRKMGASVEGADGNYPPLLIRGSRLAPIDFTTPVASAQVKTCVLFAGLLADGRTSVTEPAQSRNHTELMLREFGAAIEFGGDSRQLVAVEGDHPLRPVDYRVPGDISSAAFLVAAASMLPESRLTIKDVNLNPTRTAFLDIMKSLGAGISLTNVRSVHGEALGDIEVAANRLIADATVVIRGEMIPNLIDEIPVLAVVGTQVEGRFEVRDARELRIKESDRLRTIVDGIRAMGAEIDEFDDGFCVTGPQRLNGARIETAGDHRIAMAFSIAALAAEGITEIVDAGSAAVSFPEFYSTLRALAGDKDVIGE
jgi:3-phosphoshikimate 1-carboxyvinyltransferase